MISTNEKEKKETLHIVFLHLDLGIGGAEQLIINLGLASLPHKVSIFTTHCNQNHCFQEVSKDPNNPGKLANYVHVVGDFLPVNILGKGTAFCSTIRMIYLSIVAKNTYPDADVFVLDVLPTPIPFLTCGIRTVKSVIYYCHFPDKLLTRNSVNGDVIAAQSTTTPKKRSQNVVPGVYRAVMDRLEEWTMSYADLICVNSNFTKEEVLRVFPALRDTISTCSMYLQVLHPAIDLSKFIEPDFTWKRTLVEQEKSKIIKAPIVSLNRFERKKNIEILLHAYAGIKRKRIQRKETSPLPPLVIAGGYDPRNEENAKYLVELQDLSRSLQINDDTEFRPSVTDHDRASLLKSALCVVYTPFREHFGIVPLEAMYAGSAIVALNSGGPKETIQDGTTGYLVDLIPGDSYENLETAIENIIADPLKAIEMGKKGHEHVKSEFGIDSFQAHWASLLSDACSNGNIRRQKRSRTMVFVFGIILSVVIAILSMN
jgi:glycosyltransferase involved in cell wall biosynthesis